MSNVLMEVPVDIDKMLERLNPRQQRIVGDKLWAMRMDRLSLKMRVAARKNKITPTEIKKWCEAARKKVYEKYRR
ncbi:MAG: hypothetical protein QME32_07920 [Endomicrobiia bacterium]|nr:hypothetical protein [Endomicrobiia bacterium]